MSWNLLHNSGDVKEDFATVKHLSHITFCKLKNMFSFWFLFKHSIKKHRFYFDACQLKVFIAVSLVV